jgi:hypothetical protein
MKSWRAQWPAGGGCTNVDAEKKRRSTGGHGGFTVEQGPPIDTFLEVSKFRSKDSTRYCVERGSRTRLDSVREQAARDSHELEASREPLRTAPYSGSIWRLGFPAAQTPPWPWQPPPAPPTRPPSHPSPSRSPSTPAGGLSRAWKRCGG